MLPCPRLHQAAAWHSVLAILALGFSLSDLLPCAKAQTTASYTGMSHVLSCSTISALLPGPQLWRLLQIYLVKTVSVSVGKEDDTASWQGPQDSNSSHLPTMAIENLRAFFSLVFPFFCFSLVCSLFILFCSQNESSQGHLISKRQSCPNNLLYLYFNA